MLKVKGNSNGRGLSQLFSCLLSSDFTAVLPNSLYIFIAKVIEITARLSSILSWLLGEIARLWGMRETLLFASFNLHIALEAKYMDINCAFPSPQHFQQAFQLHKEKRAGVLWLTMTVI
jgi:hypothetical protein